jgi:hypothetical protein
MFVFRCWSGVYPTISISLWMHRKWRVKNFFVRHALRIKTEQNFPFPIEDSFFGPETRFKCGLFCAAGLQLLVV